MNPRIQIKRSNNRYNNNVKDYILSDGELLFDKSSRHLLIGDGVKKISELLPINIVNPMVYKATSLQVDQTGSTYEYTIAVPLNSNDAKNIDFELYVDVSDGQGWEVGPSGSIIKLKFSDEVVDSFNLYVFGRDKVAAPSGSFEQNSVIRLYVTLATDKKGVYISPSIAMWA